MNEVCLYKKGNGICSLANRDIYGLKTSVGYCVAIPQVTCKGFLGEMNISEESEIGKALTDIFKKYTMVSKNEPILKNDKFYDNVIKQKKDFYSEKMVNDITTNITTEYIKDKLYKDRWVSEWDYNDDDWKYVEKKFAPSPLKSRGWWDNPEDRKWGDDERTMQERIDELRRQLEEITLKKQTLKKFVVEEEKSPIDDELFEI
jgi:hypothetical protein